MNRDIYEMLKDSYYKQRYDMLEEAAIDYVNDEDYID